MSEQPFEVAQATDRFTADDQAAQRDDVDEQEIGLPSEVTDQLMDGSDQVFMAAFENAQKDGLGREAAIGVAWNSIKQGFHRGEDGSWHRKEKPDDNQISMGTESSSN
ncbi:ChaB family protein [Phormidesmis priestleyi]